MNEKKAKIIRRTLRAEGTPPRGTAYNAELPYFSSPVFFNQTLGTFQRGATLKPLRLHPACGRFKYQFVKRHLAR